MKTCYKINISKSINQLQNYIFFNQSTLEITYCERIDKQAVECSTLGTHFLVVFAKYLTLLTNLKVVITQSSCSLHVVCSFLFLVLLCLRVLVLILIFSYVFLELVKHLNVNKEKYGTLWKLNLNLLLAGISHLNMCLKNCVTISTICRFDMTKWMTQVIYTT